MPICLASSAVRLYGISPGRYDPPKRPRQLLPPQQAHWLFFPTTDFIRSRPRFSDTCFMPWIRQNSLGLNPLVANSPTNRAIFWLLPL